jgi:predicted ATPase
MANLIAIVGASGSGKSSSIRNLNSSETFIVNVASKPLPFKGWRSKYTIWNKSNPNGNYINTSDVSTIGSILNYINTKRPEIKNVIIEDAQYLMAFEAMDRAQEKGFQKFTDIAQKFYSILKTGIGMRDDLNVIMTCHSENIGTSDEPQYKIKTMGKMIDNVITVEGLFTYVFFTDIRRGDDDKPEFVFQTHSDGTTTAKSPFGCFEEDYVPNDLEYVLEKIAEYDA